MKRIIYPALLFLLSPYFLSAQMPAGIVAEYQLDNNNANDISGNNNTGTLTSTTAISNRLGIVNRAIQLTFGTSSGTLPVVVMDDFSLGFWINTTMTAAGGSQWYQGQSLVDAEVCGVVNDWGTSMLNTGKIAFGVGNPDITIVSTSNYNDGTWHFITATRDKAAGISVLYIDGSQVATTSGLNTGSLNSPTIIGLGRNNCTGSNYTGALDDIIFYGRVLSSSEVTNLYNQMNLVTLQVNWVSFTGEMSGSVINLHWQITDPGAKNYFEVERSTDGENFSSLSKVQEHDGVALSGANLLFTFMDRNPKSGINYYRIKQINADGQYSYSNVLHFTSQNSSSDISVLSNPVTDGLVVNNPAQQMISEIVVMDLTGRMISRLSVHAESTAIRVDVSKLLPGYYLLRVNLSSEKLTIPFIKQR